ncbi:MAG: MFS transporter [Conexivisphaerales archaeon]
MSSDNARDVRMLILLRGMRSFGYGFINTSLGFYLSSLGYKEVAIGVLITAAGFFSAFLIIISGVLSDRLGSRKMFLFISSALMALLGFIYSSFDSFPFLFVGALLGGAGSAGGGGPGGGPFGPAQQALLADKVEDRNRHRIFSLNAMTGTILFSFGALAAGLPELLSRYGIHPLFTYRALFLLFGILGLVSALVSLLLHEGKFVRVERKKGNSSRLIGKFTTTALLNGFGMGLIPLSLITLWFSTYFGAKELPISIMVWASNIASALSYLFAPSMASKLGTVKMIVVTRLIGVAMLASLPLLPSFLIAAPVYVIRGAFVSIGMPIRQSYMMGVVDRESRSTAVGISSGVGWGIPYAVSPAISGYVMQEVSSSLPIFASASFQVANSIVYWYFFHNLPPPEEERLHG